MYLLDYAFATSVELEPGLPYLTVLQVNSELYLRNEQVSVKILPVPAPIV